MLFRCILAEVVYRRSGASHVIQSLRFSAIFFINCSLIFSLSALASDIAVPAGGDLQAAIYAAVPGDTITLAAGAVFTGQFFFPEKNGSNWITVRSSRYANFPQLKRVGPSQVSMMAVLQPFGSNTPVTFGTRPITGNWWVLRSAPPLECIVSI